MFTIEMKEKTSDEIALKGVTADGLQPLLDSCYSGTIELTERNVADVLAAADLLSFMKVTEKCSVFLLKYLTPQNCLSTYSLGEQFNLMQLSKASNELIAEDFRSFSKCNEFGSLNSSELMEVLNRDDLNVLSEDEICESLLSWVEFDTITRAESLPNLLKAIRFQHMYKSVRKTSVRFHHFV